MVLLLIRALRILGQYLYSFLKLCNIFSFCLPIIREGAGDCSSCVSVMLELARGVSQWAHGFKNAVIFLFNTGEEEGLNGAHSFVTQVFSNELSNMYLLGL